MPTKPTMTPEMERAMTYASHNGCVVYAGCNVDRNGKMTRFSASTLAALVSRDIAEHFIHPNGGYAIRIFRIHGC